MKFQIGDMVRYLKDTSCTVAGLFIVLDIIENEEGTDSELILCASVTDIHEISAWYYANRYSLVQRPD